MVLDMVEETEEITSELADVLYHGIVLWHSPQKRLYLS